MKCDLCNWDYENQCVCENEEVHFSRNKYTDDCEGFLDKNFEQKLWDTYTECIELLGKRNHQQLAGIRDYIKQQIR